jgi:hypothetical protein
LTYNDITIYDDRDSTYHITLKLSYEVSNLMTSNALAMSFIFGTGHDYSFISHPLPPDHTLQLESAQMYHQYYIMHHELEVKAVALR